jgi:hypothetical protein
LCVHLHVAAMDMGETDESEDAPVRLARGRRESDSALGGASTSSSSSIADGSRSRPGRMSRENEEEDEEEDVDDNIETMEETVNDNSDENIDNEGHDDNSINEEIRIDRAQSEEPDAVDEHAEDVEDADEYDEGLLPGKADAKAPPILARSGKHRGNSMDTVENLGQAHSKKSSRDALAGKKRKRASNEKPISTVQHMTSSAVLKKAKRPGGKKKESDEQGASSGDEYTSNLMENYIGQVGACAALSFSAGDILSLDAWSKFSEDERDSLRAHLPNFLSPNEAEALVHMLLSGEPIHFGSPRDRAFHQVASGVTHPRIKRWRQRVALIERRHHLAGLRDYHARSIRRLSALKAPRENSDDALAHLAMIGGGISAAGDALLAKPELVDATAIAADRSPTNDWDVERWRRVLDFRNQETRRYQNPESAFIFDNPWGNSIVGPLKRGPALDGGRPREHDLLRNERPSHVTILCIVRDAASRLQGNRGTRGDICDLLRDSQYLREGATFQQLNTVVSGALDRLHYEANAPVQYDPESKEWCYLHNHLTLDDFEVPDWAIQNCVRTKTTAGSTEGVPTGGAVLSVLQGKRKKKRRK